MKVYNVTIEGDISVEAENELEAKKEALLDIGFCFDSYRVVGIECFDEEDE